MSEAGILDFAGLDAAAESAGETPTDVTPTETQVADTTETVPSDATSDSGATIEGTEVATSETPETTQTQTQVEEFKGTPQEVRSALKAFRDASPNNTAATKLLHGHYERWEAAKNLVPEGIEGIRALKEFSDLVGGAEGFETLQALKDSTEQVDQKLYAGDPEIWDYVLNDLKEQGKLDSFGKLAPSYLEHLSKVDGDAYYATMKPHFARGLVEVQMPQVLDAIVANLTPRENETPEQTQARLSQALQWATNGQNWVKNFVSEQQNAKTAQPDPERVKFEAERKAFQTEREAAATAKQEEFVKGVGTEAMSHDNKTLGGLLQPYLKMPFFKGMGRENLVPMARQVQMNLQQALGADKTYQQQMKLLWKSNDRAKILQYHTTKVQSIAPQVVRNTVQTMYPQHAKGGAAAGRIAAAEQKKEVQQQKITEATQSGQPVKLSSKPKTIVRNTDDFKYNGRNYSAKDLQMLEIAGKGFVSNGKGGWTFITWR